MTLIEFWAIPEVLWGSMLIIGLALTWFVYKFHHLKQLVNYLPTLWTSLGILFTFISICVALRESELDKLNGVRDFNFIELIKHIIPAFYTSICGIVGAIVCSMINKWKESVEEKQEDDALLNVMKNSGINVLSGTLDPSVAVVELAKLMQTANLRLDKLTQALELLASNSHDDMAALKSEAVTISKSLPALFDEQRKAFETAVDGISKKTDDAITRLIAQQNAQTTTINGLWQMIAESFKKESESRMEALKDIKTALQSVVEDMRNLFEHEIRDMVDQFAQEQIKLSMEVIAAAQASISDKANEIISDIYAKSRICIKDLKDDLDKKHSELISDFSAHTGKLMDETTKSLDKMSENLTVSLTGLQTTIDDKTSAMTTALTDSSRQIVMSISAFTGKLSGMESSFIKKITEDTELLYKRLAGKIENSMNFETLKSVNERMIKASEDFVEKLKTETAEIVKKLEEIRNSMIEAGTTARDTKESADTVSKYIFHVDEGLKTLSTIIDGMCKSLDGIISKMNLIENS